MASSSAFDEEEHAERIAENLAILDSSANDVDKRATALSLLITRLLTAPAPDPLALIEPLQKALRHSHPGLFVPALASISGLIQSIKEASNATSLLCRVADKWLTAVLERIGDGKERVKSVARDALDAIAEATLASTQLGGSSSKETPGAAFMRVLKDNGLAAKSPRVREGTTAHLPILRHQVKNALQLKPILPNLVDLLSDADGPTREAARQSVVALFAPAPAAAKTDLKKELERKQVRKQTADPLLASVFAEVVEPPADLAGADGDAELQAGSAARSGPSRAAPTGPQAMARGEPTPSAQDDVPMVYVASRADIERTFAPMQAIFEGKETEHNWAAREASMMKIRGILRTGTAEKLGQSLAKEIRGLGAGICKGTASLRTTLAMHSISLVGEAVVALGDELHESVVDLFFTSLFGMAGFTKKLVANAAQSAVALILQNVSYRATFLEALWGGLQEKNVAIRSFACAHLCIVLERNALTRKHQLEAHSGLETFQNFFKKALPDPNPDVRSKAREGFGRFQAVWPVEAERLLESLDPTTRKQIATAAATSQSVAANATTAKARTVSAAPPRRPGGPSSALLAAKRAASERMAQQRKEQAEAQDAEEADGDLDAHTPPTERAGAQASNLTKPAAPGNGHSIPSSASSGSASRSVKDRIAAYQTSALAPSRASKSPESTTARPVARPVRAQRAPAATPDHDETVQLADLGVADASVDLMGSASPTPQRPTRRSLLPAQRSHAQAPPESPAKSSATSNEDTKKERLNGLSGDSAAAEVALGSPRAKASSSGTSISILSNRPGVQEWVTNLHAGNADLDTFKRLGALSREYKLPLPVSATPLDIDAATRGEAPLQSGGGALGLQPDAEQDSERVVAAWREAQIFERLWEAIMRYLNLPSADVNLTGAALVVLRRILENQLPLISSTDKETQFLSLVFRRRLEKENVSRNACESLIDAWSSGIEPILGLGTLMSALEPALRESEASRSGRERVRKLGLYALRKLLARLPAELVEEELPRFKAFVKDAFADPNTDLRIAATDVIKTANSRLKDLDILFSILAPLEPHHKDLLSYYISKNA
ncbi:ARM repeat-containing protein [Ceraceosorus guamensis]|uniref:ARM repeat-containing protein n=1 Tax=Ceraceosorus guamensis TaxID=1522189 RepID=A0A316VZP0_9BASI|nr:ARM repeat-containing protein [Ceraceosorus guamensis]PWN42734.1 ARM repeat-containing protein [Ceraceosorus guamensis]